MTSLTEIFDLSEHVFRNGFLVLNNFLNNHGLWERFFDALGHNGLGCTVKQLLLAVTEGVSLDVAIELVDAAVGSPIIVATALLTRSKVSMSALVHFGSFCLFFIRTLGRVQHVLGIQRGTGRDTESVVLTLGLGRPLIATLIALAERLADCRGILGFFRVIEFISETIQILSFDHYINRVGCLSLAAKVVALGEVGLAFLETRVDHDLTRLIVVGLSVLANMRRSSSVTPAFIAVHLLSNGHVSIVATGSNDVASSSNFRDGIGTYLGC